MNANTLKAITRHGESLLAAFPSATEKDPVALCKKLRRVETAANRFATDYCNGDIQADDNNEVFYRHYGRGTNGPFLTEKVDGPEKFLRRVRAILGITSEKAKEIGLFVNLDARGYSLKLSDDWTMGYNSKAERRIHTDWGGYGILAPDLTQ